MSNEEDLGSEEEETTDQTIVVDGEMLTLDEVRNLKSKEKDLVSGFHTKTQALAEERKEFEVAKQGLEDQRIFNDKARVAQEHDLNFYTANGVDAWEDYQSEYDQLVGRKGNPQVKIDQKKPQEDSQAMKDLTASVSQLKADNAARNAKAIVDGAKNLIVKKYAFADEEAVNNDLYIFYNEKHRLPSRIETEDLVKEHHKKALASADRINKAREESKEKERNIRLPSGKGSGVPKLKPENIPSASNVDAVTAAGNEFLKSRWGG